MHWKLFNTYVSAYVNSYVHICYTSSIQCKPKFLVFTKKKSKLAQSLLDHTHKPLKFDQVSLHKTWKIFKMILDGAVTESKLWQVESIILKTHLRTLCSALRTRISRIRTTWNINQSLQRSFHWGFHRF